MKTHAFFGAIIALANAGLTLLLYFLDFHNNPDKFLVGLALLMLGSLVITSIGLVMGIRAVRKEKGAGTFSYGQALGAGMLIVVVNVILGITFQITYSKLINPDYSDTAVQWVQSMMERGNVPSDKIEEKVAEMREGFTVSRQIRSGLGWGLGFGGAISLIAAAFLKRKLEDEDSGIKRV